VNQELHLNRVFTSRTVPGGMRMDGLLKREGWIFRARAVPADGGEDRQERESMP
jgi:hypothetical protein